MAGRQKPKKIVSIIVFIIGFFLVSYPLVSPMVEQQYQNDAVATYQKAVHHTADEKITSELVKAQEYNRMLYQSGMLMTGNIDTDILNEDIYNSILNLSGSGVMGSIEIPKISVNLPIYHGTSEEVLNIGVGHVEQTSLPIGGENTRTVLTGHRGLPNAKLFTRLDELEKGDMFFIRVLNEILAYEVYEIDVIVPEDIDKLSIQEGMDLATLLTCHPYGINSHRLLVTGKRVEYKEEVYEEIESEMVSGRELIFASIPFVFACIGIMMIVKNRKRKRADTYESKIL